MRRIVPILLIVVAVTAFWFRDRWLPPPPGRTDYLGYVEGETVLVGPPQAGRIVTVNVAKGGGVVKDQVLFGLDTAVAEAEVARAQAAVTTAEAAHADLLTGKREPELAVIRAQRREAEAGLVLARKELERASTLADTGIAAQSRLDSARSQVAIYEARIAQADASEQVAGLAARTPQIEAAASRVEEARTALAETRQKLADLTPKAPVAAVVDDVYFDAGEWVAAGQPVVSLLPPGNLTLRFFVPEAALGAASPGTRVTFHCDGCRDGRNAVITRTASQPEFTPPVIYSQNARAKLVFLVEARPDDAAGLRPGLPIEVEPLQ